MESANAKERRDRHPTPEKEKAPLLSEAMREKLMKEYGLEKKAQEMLDRYEAGEFDETIRRYREKIDFDRYLEWGSRLWSWIRRPGPLEGAVLFLIVMTFFPLGDTRLGARIVTDITAWLFDLHNYF